MNAKYRFWMYVAAAVVSFILATVVAALVMFKVVTTEQVQAGLLVFGLAFSAIFSVAAKNTPKE